MLIAPNADGNAHVLSHDPATTENPDGYHRLIGGSVELGETHVDAIAREVHEELGAAIDDLLFLATVESIFWIDGTPGHEIVFLYTGRLSPQPAQHGATLTESDGSVVPVVWRSGSEERERLPLYPAATVPWVERVLTGSVG